MQLLRFSSLLFLSAAAVYAGTCTPGVTSRLTQLEASVASCKYVDYETGSDSNSGDDEAHPWKHSPGMRSFTTSTSSPTDACTGNCAAFTPSGNVGVIFRGGVVWPYTVFPLLGCAYNTSNDSCGTDWYGSSTTSVNGCQGSGCLYWGVDPTWNKGAVTAINITRDLGGCSSAPTITLTGGGASVQATATAVLVPNTANFFTGFLKYISVDTPGSGYTTSPTVTITGGGCNTITATADITRAVFDFGGQSGYTWNQTSGNHWAHGPFWMRSNNAIWDSFEVRNLTATMASAAAFGNRSLISSTATNDTIANAYAHGIVQSTVSIGGSEDVDLINTNGGGLHEVRNSFASNGDALYLGPQSSCAANDICTWGSAGLNMRDGYYHHNRLSWTRWQFRGGSTTPGRAFILASNEAWLNTYSCCGGHVNDMYLTVNNGATGYVYNNFTHDDVGGSSNQIPQSDGAQWYVFNNLRVSVGGGSAAWGIDGVTGATATPAFMRFYNNTIANLNTAASPASGQGNCINGSSGPFDSSLTVTLQNNHCINAPTPFSIPGGMNTQTHSGATDSGAIAAAQLAQTAAAASAQGYVYSNLYAPTDPTDGTASFSGANLTQLCSGSLLPLCKDVAGGLRPTSGAWNAGAYQYVAAPPPLVLASVPRRVIVRRRQVMAPAPTGIALKGNWAWSNADATTTCWSPCTITLDTPASVGDSIVILAYANFDTFACTDNASPPNVYTVNQRDYNAAACVSVNITRPATTVTITNPFGSTASLAAAHVVSGASAIDGTKQYDVPVGLSFSGGAVTPTATGIAFGFCGSNIAISPVTFNAPWALASVRGNSSGWESAVTTAPTSNGSARNLSGTTTANNCAVDGMLVLK